MGVGEARAKLLLFGEHAAVYGHPAVGVSLPWPLRVTHVPGGRWAFPGLGDHEAAVGALVAALEALADERGLVRPVPGTVEVATDVPLASGYGSSGALCAALVNAFWPALPLADRDVLSWRAEGLFHGTPSGIDTALALRQGWWRLDPTTRPVTALALPDPGLVLVTGAVVRGCDTKGLVGALAARRNAGDRTVIDGLETLGDVSHIAADALAARRPQDLPPLVHRARLTLAALGLETPALTSVLDTGLARGALAGKLSGAGGGGAFYLMFADEAEATAALPALEASLEASLWTARPRLVVAIGPGPGRVDPAAPAKNDQAKYE